MIGYKIHREDCSMNFGAATVKASSAYIDETSGKESFISSHLRLGRVVARIMTLFDRYSGTPIYIAL